MKMLGEVPQGLPHFGIGGLARSDLNALLPRATARFLLGAVETAAIGRMFARKHEYRHKLVFRNIAKDASSGTRAARIDAAVARALASFLQ